MTAARSAADIADLRSALEFLASIPGQLVSTREPVDAIGELAGIYLYQIGFSQLSNEFFIGMAEFLATSAGSSNSATATVSCSRASRRHRWWPASCKTPRPRSVRACPSRAARWKCGEIRTFTNWPVAIWRGAVFNHVCRISAARHFRKACRVPTVQGKGLSRRRRPRSRVADHAARRGTRCSGSGGVRHCGRIAAAARCRAPWRRLL